MYYSIGPSKSVAAADGNLYVASHGAIHVFGPDAARRGTISLEKLGATLVPSDFALHRDGRLVVANPDGSTLDRCRPPDGPCEHLDLGLTRVFGQVALPLNSVKLWIDEDSQRYYVSDNAGHRLLIADFRGRVLATTRPNLVWYPNQLQLVRPGELRVVDTNHTRLATFDVTHDKFGRLVAETRTRSEGVGRAGRRWPFDAVNAPDGYTWVLIARDHMQDADVTLFDATGKARRRIELGEISDPFDIELWNGRMIVADATNYRLQSISLDGARVEDFGDAAFRKELAEAKTVPDLWRRVRLAAQVAIVAFPLLGILVLWKLGAGTQPAPPRGSPARALTGDIAWIESDTEALARFQARMTRTTSIFAIVMLLAVGLAIYAFRGALDSPFILAQAVVLLLALVVAVAMPHLMKRSAPGSATPTRLGASSSGLHWSLPKPGFTGFVQSTGSAPWTSVFFDGRRIAAGDALVFVKLPFGVEVFRREELSQAILAHIPPGNFVHPALLELRAARAGNRSLRAGWVVVAIALALLAWHLLLR